MQYLDLTLPTLEENLALDEALLLEAEAGRGGEVVRLWEWPSFAVVLGAGCRLAEEVHQEACQADNVPIRRRSSGGGTVLLGRGCLLYSFIFSYGRAAELREIRPSYRFILERLRDTLLPLESGIDLAGTSDLCVLGRKFSGNSQQRKRSHLLHHGTLLYHFSVEAIGRYLREPSRQPKYRLGRSHRDFVGNLPVATAVAKDRLRSAWDAEQQLASWQESEVERLVLERYSRDEWTRRR